MPFSSLPGLATACALALAPPVPPAPTEPAGVPVDAELAAEAPQPAWVPEGGTAAHKTGKDPGDTHRAMRRSANTAIAGVSLAVVGFAGATTGAILLTLPKKQIEDLKSDNGGVVPPGDPKRQSAITMSRVAPVLLGVSAGVMIAGVAMAVIAGRRFKKLREERRTSTVAFAPMPSLRGFGMAAEVRF